MSLSPEQIALRRKGVSASELAAVAGLNPWMSAVNVWENKLGLNQQDISLNPNIIRGSLFETPVIAWYALLTGRTVTQQPTITHPDYPLIMATPDGIASLAGHEDRCLEIKCPGLNNQSSWGAAGTDEIPSVYQAQVQAQLAVTGLKKADVVMFTGVEPRIYHVAYDDELFQCLREIAEKFWRDHVLTRIPPPPDATPMYADFLARYMPQQDDTEPLDLRASEDAAYWVKQLRIARAQLKECEDLEEIAKNHIKKMMGGHSAAKLPGGFATWKNSKPRACVDWQAVVRDAQLEKSLVDRHTAEGKAPRPFKIKFEEV